MSEHLPECHWSKPCEPLHGGPPLDEHYAGTIGGAATDTPYCSNCAVWCICDRLLACEQRVAREVIAQMNEGTQYLAGTEYGYAEALTAARAAVAACRGEHGWVRVPEDAIDALRATP